MLELDEWQLQALLRIVPPELHGVVKVPDGGFRDEIMAKAVATALGDAHPAHDFFDGAVACGGFTVERR